LRETAPIIRSTNRPTRISRTAAIATTPARTSAASLPTASRRVRQTSPIGTIIRKPTQTTMTTRRTARLDWAVVLPLMLMTGDAVAMDTFQDLRRALEAIAVEKTADPNRLGALLGGTFRPTTAEMPYHTVYRGVMEPESAFSGCELRLPKSPQATSALVTRTGSPMASLRRAEVHQA